MTQVGVREYAVSAASTAVFGRVLCAARNHHFVSDGPVQNGCPGEALTPPELYLSGIAACGVELLQVLAREGGVPLRSVALEIRGFLDRSRPIRPDLTLFNRVCLDFQLTGVDRAQAEELVAAFQKR